MSSKLQNNYRSLEHWLRTFVKLQSDLRVLTQLRLDGVGVDFVFVCHKKEEGRKEEGTHAWLQPK